MQRLSKNFLFSRIIFLMLSSFYASDDIILDMQQTNDPALYFIIEGEVIEYQYPNGQVKSFGNEIIMKNKKKGEIVGLQQFMTNSQKATCYAKSLGVTELHYLKYKDFVEIIQKFPTEKEHYYHVKDQVLLNKKTKFLDLECQLCFQKDHFDMECSETFYEQRKRLINFKYGRVPVNKHKRKDIKYCYHTIAGYNKINQDILKYMKLNNIQQCEYQDDDNQDKGNHSEVNLKENQLENKKDQQIEKKNSRQIKKEQKILNLLNQYNQDKIYDQENEFALNFLSPSSNHNFNNNSNIILIDPQDQTNQLDVDDLNLLSPSKLEYDSPYTRTNNLQQDYARLQQKEKESQNTNKKENIVQSDEDEQSNQNSSSSIQTFTPNKKNSSTNGVYGAKGQNNKYGSNGVVNSKQINRQYENNFKNENKMESEKYPPTPQIQNFTPELKPQLQNANTLSINYTNGDETTKSVRALSKLNRKQRSFNKSQNSDEDVNGQNKILQQQQQQQQNFHLAQLNKIAERHQSIKSTQNQITDRSVIGLDKEQEYVSIDYSVMTNFKIYFPHNNFSSIFRVNKSKHNSRRSVVNPLLRSSKYDKSQTIK